MHDCMHVGSHAEIGHLKYVGILRESTALDKSVVSVQKEGNEWRKITRKGTAGRVTVKNQH